MTEYQYYAFQAIDKPLDEKGIQALENLSSRARITPTSFVNTYNWGDFKGNPLTLMEKYFDAFFYVANWGTTGEKLRTVEDLMTKAEAYTTERKRRIAEQKAEERARKKRQEAIARKKYLNDLAKREDKVWIKVNDLIKTKRQPDYDEAVKLLVDLRDLSKKINKESMFKDKMGSIYEKHSRKPSLVRRLKNAGLDG